MVNKVATAVVSLWGQTVGAVSWLDEREYGVFEYAPEFLGKGLDISPIHMGLELARQGDGIFTFPQLNKQTYLGLPGLLADCLPDKFGNSIIDAWLARNGRDAADFNPVERLCYTGKRGMGALEFSPATIEKYDKSVPVAVTELVQLAQHIVAQRLHLNVEISESSETNTDAIMDILRVGTSAGGARPKAVIAMDTQGNVMSGQTEAPPEFDYWLLKFDGVTDLELGEPQGFGRIEYAYYLMAQAAGITMAESRLLEESGRAHFLTKRFDRVQKSKLHMQSLCGMAHFDFNLSGGYGYEQAFTVMRKLYLSKAEATQQFRRMVFNIIARNQDDHTKNIAFIMQADGRWSLSPAFDLTYSHNPAGRWTSQHQMSVNGKRDGFTRADLIAVGESISIARPQEIIDEITSAVEKWPEYAESAGVPAHLTKEIKRNLRLNLPAR